MGLSGSAKISKGLLGMWMPLTNHLSGFTIPVIRNLSLSSSSLRLHLVLAVEIYSVEGDYSTLFIPSFVKIRPGRS